MNNQSGFIGLRNGQLHYIKMGSGKRLLLAFHGYHNDASIFSGFENLIGNDFTILSFNLPFHGDTKWKDGRFLEKTDLVSLVNQVRTLFGVEKVDLLGYSMGGRVCLNIIELMPEKIERVILVACDGLIFNPFYFFVTRNTLGKALFGNFIHAPKKYLALISRLRKWNFIDASRYKFFMYYLESETDRQFLHKVWPAMSMLLSDNNKVRKAIEKYQLPVFIFMGKYDRIIPPKNALEFKKDLKTVELFIVEKGHKVMDKDTVAKMAECLL